MNKESKMQFLDLYIDTTEYFTIPQSALPVLGLYRGFGTTSAPLK